MGCTQAKVDQSQHIITLQQHKIHQENLIYQRKHQIIENNPNVLPKNQITPTEASWQEFSHQSDALNILCKQQLNSFDLQFLLKNQIWKEQWFQMACELLSKNIEEIKPFESKIMHLFLLVKLKQAQFLQNQQFGSILCQDCYQKEILKFRIDSKNVDFDLFTVCKTCQGNGWTKKSSQNKNQRSNCVMCKRQIIQCKVQTECSDCNTLGYKWKQ